MTFILGYRVRLDPKVCLLPLTLASSIHLNACISQSLTIAISGGRVLHFIEKPSTIARVLFMGTLAYITSEAVKCLQSCKLSGSENDV